ncbi:archaeal proteasome endopeptidase complex subunit alpha [Candidatus Bathyarchaeota archaeon]|jgi:proteasome alpha subunit|nr:MAG: archaeal proteasome endopeptidase complex subunit alpha [Candidatus Bathyarchaeota archaeon]
MMRSNQYDAAITIFSPEGRLYQVEYALELVKRGAPIVGVYSPEGVILAADETPESTLDDPNYLKKIFQFDDHVGAAIAGLSSDARVLMGQGRVFCQSNRLLYDEPADIEALIGTLSSRIQVYTQHGGIRPFGVSLIVAGVDTTGPKLMTTDPSGSYRGYKARALGRNADKANTLLDEKYVEGLSMDDAIRLGIEAVDAASGGKVTPATVKVAVIPSEARVFKRLSEEEIANYV